MIIYVLMNILQFKERDLFVHSRFPVHPTLHPTKKSPSTTYHRPPIMTVSTHPPDDPYLDLLHKYSQCVSPVYVLTLLQV